MRSSVARKLGVTVLQIVHNQFEDSCMRQNKVEETDEAKEEYIEKTVWQFTTDTGTSWWWKWIFNVLIVTAQLYYVSSKRKSSS